MEKGQSPSEANKGMRRFVLGRSWAVLVAPILISVLVFNHFKKKKTRAESTEGASTLFKWSILTGGSNYRYGVFLSSRGSDISKGFVDLLYNNLVNAGAIPIDMFRDDDGIPIGEEFGPKLLDAITQSKISILIISEDYGSSEWCLRELIRIMDYKKSTSHRVMPIFYKVHASDVRHQKGSFGKAFRSRKKNFDKEDIQEAQRALEQVSYLNGWESEKFANGYFTST